MAIDGKNPCDFRKDGKGSAGRVGLTFECCPRGSSGWSSFPVKPRSMREKEWRWKEGGVASTGKLEEEVAVWVLVGGLSYWGDMEKGEDEVWG